MVESYGVLEYKNGWQLHSLGCKNYSDAKDRINRLIAVYGRKEEEYRIIAIYK